MRRRSLPFVAAAGVLCLFPLASVIGAGSSADQNPAVEKKGLSGQSEATNPFAGKPDAAHAGKQLFLQTGCYNCHGADATGGGIAPNLTVSKLDPQQMFNTIHNGRPGTLMPPWGKQLSSDEIWKIVTYLRSLNRAG